jgi:hypothetical protein
MMKYTSLFTPAPSPTPRHHVDRYTPVAHHATYTKAPIEYPSSLPCVDEAFDIPAGYWWDSLAGTYGKTAKTISQYCATYGAPEEVYYGKSYRPKLAVFDGTKFIKKVDVNYILTEMNGRTSFRYSMTAGDAKCLSRPTSARFGANTTRISNCFIAGNTSITSADLNVEYEILNYTSGNSIIWTDRVNGIYLFEAKVVDDNYSFCEFKTFFAVKVYGAPDGVLWQALTIMGFNILGIICLVISYLWYANSRKQMLNKEKLD